MSSSGSKAPRSPSKQPAPPKLASLSTSPSKTRIKAEIYWSTAGGGGNRASMAGGATSRSTTLMERPLYGSQPSARRGSRAPGDFSLSGTWHGEGGLDQRRPVSSYFDAPPEPGLAAS